ncbi:MAG: FHA domain-containing protein [Thermincola sp.]|nr:FHA domain-containing protein [Thermincola sp.]MDT3703996.1 FHA domain-containing protein [Thermincola sp.]
MGVILLVLKFGLLAVLYAFILRVFYFIFNDLRQSAGKPAADHMAQTPSFGAELVVTESSDPALRQGDIIKLGYKTTVGRGANHQIALTDTFVSHDHAAIIFQKRNYYLEDLNSVNGTYINGVRVNQPVSLNHGDTIKIAGVTFKFVRWEYEME